MQMLTRRFDTDCEANTDAKCIKKSTKNDSLRFPVTDLPPVTYTLLLIFCNPPVYLEYKCNSWHLLYRSSHVGKPSAWENKSCIVIGRRPYTLKNYWLTLKWAAIWRRLVYNSILKLETPVEDPPTTTLSSLQWIKQLLFAQ